MTQSNSPPRDAAPSAKRHRRIASKFCVSVSAFALVLAGSGLPVGQHGVHYLSRASAAPEELFADLAPIADAELDRQRGGFKVGNLDISIGVSVESTIDGFVQVISNFSISEPGKIVDVGQIVKSIPEVDVPKVTVPKVEIPKVEVAKVEVPKVEVPEIEVPKVVVPNVEVPEIEVPNVTEAVLGEAETLVEESVNLALDSAQAAFNSPEFSENAEVTESGNADAPADLADTTDQLNSAIDAGQKTLSDALPVNTATPENGTENHQAPVPGSVTLTAADAGPSGEAASPSPHPSAEADAVVSGPDAEPDTMQIIATALNGKAEVVHRADNGHLTIIRNTVDGVSIRQSVSLNLTVENFTHIQEATRIQRNLASIARQIGVFSLRR